MQQVTHGDAKLRLIQVGRIQDAQVASCRHASPQQVVVLPQFFQPLYQFFIGLPIEQPLPFLCRQPRLCLSHAALFIRNLIRHEGGMCKPIPIGIPRLNQAE